MIRIAVAFFVWGSAVASAIVTPSDASACAATMVSSFPAAAVRAEIAEAAARDRQRGRNEARISPLRGSEAPEIPVLVSSAPTQVLYLGSGADIFRVLRDFPAADEIHLVDLLNWGKCPASVLIEVAARLRSLPGAKVRFVSRGFTQGMTAEDLCSRERFYAKLEESRWQATPAVWEVEWESPSAQTLHRRVSLHVLNYHEPIAFPALLERIGARGPIVGVMSTGAWEPEDVSKRAALEALAPSGAYVFQTFGAHFGGAPPAPDDALLRELGYRTVEVPADETNRLPFFAHRTFVAVRLKD